MFDLERLDDLNRRLAMLESASREAMERSRDGVRLGRDLTEHSKEMRRAAAAMLREAPMELDGRG